MNVHTPELDLRQLFAKVFREGYKFHGEGLCRRRLNPESSCLEWSYLDVECCYPDPDTMYRQIEVLRRDEYVREELEMWKDRETGRTLAYVAYRIFVAPDGRRIQQQAVLPLEPIKVLIRKIQELDGKLIKEEVEQKVLHPPTS